MQNLFQKIDDGVKAVFESDSYKKCLRYMSKFTNYSAGNCILIKKIEALAAEHITDDTVRHTFGIYKKACAEMPESLWPKAIDVIYSIKMPDPIGKFWDNKSLRFYDQAKERICETAAKYMPISSDLKHQEEINNYISYGGQR